MKNILILLLFAVIGTAFISCDKEDKNKVKKYGCNIPDEWNPDINPKECPVASRMEKIEYHSDDRKVITYKHSIVGYCEYLNSAYYPIYKEDFGMFLSASDMFDSTNIFLGDGIIANYIWGTQCGKERSRDTTIIVYFK